MAQIVETKSNPLLLEDIVHRVFNLLDSYKDLKSCYDVCELWQKLAPEYVVQLQPPVLIQRKLTDDGEGLAYLRTISSDPNLKAAKFKFHDTDLASCAVNYFLKFNGQEIEQLELIYSPPGEEIDEEGQVVPSYRRTARRNRPTATLTSRHLRDLLMNKAPFLETLKITALPASIRRAKLFPDHASLDPDAHLLMKRIEFTLNYMPEAGTKYSQPFLTGLFAICPKLEELVIDGMELGASGDTNNSDENIIRALIQTNRLHQIKVLKIQHVDVKLLNLLTSALNRGQLRSLDLGILHTDVPPFHLRNIIARQNSSLMYVRLPEDCTKDVILLPIPNLVQLKIRKPYLAHRGLEEPPAEPCRPITGPSLDYANKFPKLKLLGIAGHLDYFSEDQIFPEHVQPAKNVQIMQEIPLGVGRALMTRIGHLFPNLAIIRTSIPCGQEGLLISIWEHCPNITELFLTLAEDIQRNPSQIHERRSLDAIFSGVPEAECQRIRLLPMEEQEMELMSTDFGNLRAGKPSICNLKKLRKLFIGGPGTSLFSWSGTRRDQLSNVCGYSTFANLSSELVFLQVDLGLINISPSCTEYICDRLKLQNAGKKRYLPLPLFRLIRPGFGYNALGFLLPMQWFGLNEDDLPMKEEVLENQCWKAAY